MNGKDQSVASSLHSKPGLASAATSHLSLENVHGSIEVPPHQASFWQQWQAFVGPAILVSVGYMDPGNWGTDLQGGAQYKYGLVPVVGLASLLAIFMQVISARHGKCPAMHLRTGKSRHWMRPRPVLPRLVSILDALTQLSQQRSRQPNFG